MAGVQYVYLHTGYALTETRQSNFLLSCNIEHQKHCIRGLPKKFKSIVPLPAGFLVLRLGRNYLFPSCPTTLFLFFTHYHHQTLTKTSLSKVSHIPT